MAKYRKLGRKTDHRLAMLRNMTQSALKSGRIITTETRAKELRRQIDKMITLAKKGDLHSRRQTSSYIYDKNVVHQLFHAAPKIYDKRNSGYTRMYKIGPRRGDAAPMVVLEIIDGGIYSIEKDNEAVKESKK